MCSSRQISNGAIPKSHTRRWRVIIWSNQIQVTRGTTDIPHGYSAWHSIFGSDPKSIYTGSTKTRIDIVIRKQSDIDNLLWLKLERLSYNSKISIWVLHFSWFLYYLMEVQKTEKRIKIISGSRIPHDGQYLFGDSLVAISVAWFKGVM